MNSKSITEKETVFTVNILSSLYKRNKWRHGDYRFYIIQLFSSWLPGNPVICLFVSSQFVGSLLYLLDNSFPLWFSLSLIHHLSILLWSLFDLVLLLLFVFDTCCCKRESSNQRRLLWTCRFPILTQEKTLRNSTGCNRVKIRLSQGTFWYESRYVWRNDCVTLILIK